MWANAAFSEPVMPTRDVYVDANRDWKLDLTGEMVTVEGQVTVSSGFLHSSYLKVSVQDESGGLFAFNEQIVNPVSVGDNVRVTGRVSQYNGLLQIVSSRLELLGKIAALDPQLVNVSEIQNERFEGVWGRATGKVIHKWRNKGGEFFMLHESGDVMTVFRSTVLLGVSFEGYAIGDQVRGAGIAGQWDPDPPGNGNCQIYTRSRGNIVRLGLPGGYCKQGLLIGGTLFMAVSTWGGGLRHEVRRQTSKLVDSQQCLRAVYELTLDSVALADADMIIIDANPALCRLVGIETGGTVGRHLKDFLQLPHGDSLEQIRWPIQEFGTVRSSAELVTVGDPQPVDVTLNTLAIAGHEDLLVVARDISSHKQQEQALFSSQIRLECTLDGLGETQGEILQQERLSALGQMASGIAHDFNNALQTMLGYAEIAISELCDLPSGVDSVLSKPASRDMLAIAVAQLAKNQLNPDSESA
jgi:PAS domain S-box-containing protein